MHTLSFKVSLRLFFSGVIQVILAVTFTVVVIAAVVIAIVVTIIVVLVSICISGIQSVLTAAVILALICLSSGVILRLPLVSRCLGTIPAAVLPCGCSDRKSVV